MFQAVRPRYLLSLKAANGPCLVCQCNQRPFSSTASTRAARTEANPSNPKTKPPEEDAGPEDHTPKPLNRPLGLPHPPKSGENSGIDTRPWRQRRDDFLDYDKHLRRREQLTAQVAKPYFREWKNMRWHEGKTFLAPRALFRADKALYFPNLQGTTLLSRRDIRDTTPVLRDRISVVSVFSSMWAEQQRATFVESTRNPELTELLAKNPHWLQRVELNVEDNRMKALLVKIFMGGLRKQFSPEVHGKYFLVQRGLTDDIRDYIGAINSKVGYVYLVDSNCKIRWAGSGNAEGDEAKGLVNGAKKLLEERAKVALRSISVSSQEQKSAPVNENTKSIPQAAVAA